MSFEFIYGGQSVVCRITEGALHIGKPDKSEAVININDIIGVDFPIAAQNTKDGNTEYSVTVAIIDKLESKLWRRKDLVFKGTKDTCSQMMFRLKAMLTNLQRPRKLLVLISPVSGAHRSETTFYEKVKPLFDLAGIETETLVSKYTTHIRNYIPTCNLDDIDGLVVMGGDGSFNQCVNGIFERSQKSANIDYNNPDAKLIETILPIGHIPTGTANVITGYCCGGVIDIETSILHIISGKERKLGVTAVYDNTKWIANSCIMAAFGIMSDMTRYTENFRWLKTYRYLIVPAIFYSFKAVPLFKGKLTVKKRDGTVDTTEEVLAELLVTNHDTFNSHEYFDSDTWKDNRMDVKKYHSTIRFNYWHDFMSKLLKGPNYVKPDFVEYINAIAVKIEIQNMNTCKPSDGQIKLSLMVDAEYVDLVTSTLDFRLKEPIIRVYSSL